jgi:hypothetical protein
MAAGGNLLTHYNYRFARVELQVDGAQLQVQIYTPNNKADLEVVANLTDEAARLPNGSCFETERDARRFAGPLPYTFDYEPQTHSIIAIRGRRREWHPRLVSVDVRHCSFFDRAPFTGKKPRLASAFYLANVPYRWDRGVRYPLPR